MRVFCAISARERKPGTSVLFRALLLSRDRIPDRLVLQRTAEFPPSRSNAARNTTNAYTPKVQPTPHATYYLHPRTEAGSTQGKRVHHSVPA